MTEVTELDNDVETARRPRFSNEIHGVRGIALTLVVLFHLFGAGKVSGGVDVFLVISAYLLTGSLARSLRRGDLSLPRRYARTFSRLIPTALLVVTVTTAAGLFILPRSKWLQLFREMAATSLLRENVELATAGLSYAAAGQGASPFQHFWSLSIQGQFLLLWPAVAFLLMFTLRGKSTKLGPPLLGFGAAAMSTISFVYAIYLVNLDQQVAYYSLGARLWEFGLGSVAALLLPRIGLNSRFRGALGWLGLILILSSGFAVDGLNLFPGPWTLWPVSGTILVLVSASGSKPAAFGFSSLMSVRPISWLANIAYQLYLWHWPFLVFFLVIVQKTQVNLLDSLLLLAASVLFSTLTRRFWTDPIVKLSNRLSKTVRGVWLTVGTLLFSSLLLAGVGTFAAHAETERITAEIAAAQSRAKSDPTTHYSPGEIQDVDEPLIPSVDAAESDKPSIYDQGCIQTWRDEPGSDEVLICDGTEGTKRVILSGGSHVVQYYPALKEIADLHDWELIVIDKDGCRLAVPDPNNPRAATCDTWNERAIPTIIDMQPDAVITLGTVTSQGDRPEDAEHVPTTQIEVWEEFAEAGIPVVVLRDSPRFSVRVPECIETQPANKCGVERDLVYEITNPLDQIGLPDLVYPVDTAGLFCSNEECPPIVGNIIAYRDASHITATYAYSLVPELTNLLMQSAPFLFE